MAAKVDPRDWNRLFRPGSPQRGGPLRALANVIMIGTVLGLLGGAAFFGVRFGLDRTRQSAASTQTSEAERVANIYATRTARALASTATTDATPTLAPEQPIGVGEVHSEGNLRREPRVAAETVLGLVCPGDRVDILEERNVDGMLWYRIRLNETPHACSDQRATVGSSGWTSSLIVNR